MQCRCHQLVTPSSAPMAGHILEDGLQWRINTIVVKLLVLLRSVVTAVRCSGEVTWCHPSVTMAHDGQHTGDHERPVQAVTQVRGVARVHEGGAVVRIPGNSGLAPGQVTTIFMRIQNTTDIHSMCEVALFSLSPLTAEC